MARQIIRLTESDLHRIIKESVNQIIKEETEADLEAAKKRLLKAKKGRDTKELVDATKEYHRIKALLGQSKTIVNPDVNFSKEKNKEKGIKTSHGKFGRPNDIGALRQINKDDNEKLQVNDVDAILGNN